MNVLYRLLSLTRLLGLFHFALAGPLSILVVDDNLARSSTEGDRSNDVLRSLGELRIFGQSPAIYSSRSSFGEVFGHWSVLSLVPRLSKSMRETSSEWLLVCEPNTEIYGDRLEKFLSSLDAGKSHLIGFGLEDVEAVVIHHYHMATDGEGRLQYPDFGAGLIVSRVLIESLANKLKNHRFDFVIDPKHEFAKTVQKLAGVKMESRPDTFCAQEGDECATQFKRQTFDALEKCANERRLEKDDHIVYGVKTYSDNHRTRLVVVKRTWAKDVLRVRYFSDRLDQYVPTEDVGVKNTERGHCAKTFAILKRLLEDNKATAKWIVVADDDTLLSPARLACMLDTIDWRKDVIVGERYGYGFTMEGTLGYDYPTGGSGMIFSARAARLLLEKCACPSDDAPDDMIIGVCARQLGIDIIHSAGFHQARARDYDNRYLTRQPALSLHKFYDNDPYDDYMRLLHVEAPIAGKKPAQHNEL